MKLCCWATLLFSLFWDRALTCAAAMFEPKENPGYEKLTDDAARLIAKWTTNEWYESSTEGELAPEA